MRKSGRPFRFLIAGGANTGFGLAFYPALLWAEPWLRVHYLLALGIAQAVCLCFAFATYRLFVFRSHGPLLAEFARFASFYLANYAINWAVLPMLVEWAGLPPAAAQLGFNVVVIAGSYVWHSRVTFRPRKAAVPASAE